MSQVASTKKLFIVRHIATSERYKKTRGSNFSPSFQITTSLNSHPSVLWAEQVHQNIF